MSGTENGEPPSNHMETYGNHDQYFETQALDQSKSGGHYPCSFFSMSPLINPRNFFSMCCSFNPSQKQESTRYHDLR